MEDDSCGAAAAPERFLSLLFDSFFEGGGREAGTSSNTDRFIFLAPLVRLSEPGSTLTTFAAGGGGGGSSSAAALFSCSMAAMSSLNLPRLSDISENLE